MTVFYLNEVLYTNREGYNSLAKLFNQIIQSNDEEISISFARTTWFEANLCAVLGAMIRILEDDYDFSIQLINIPIAIQAILTRNGFIGNIDHSTVDFSKETVVTFQQFAPNHDTAFDSYLKRELLVKKTFLNIPVYLEKEYAPVYLKSLKMPGHMVNANGYILADNIIRKNIPPALT